MGSTRRHLAAAARLTKSGLVLFQDRIPLQYLLGRTHWRDLILAVGPGCLIPRPETELLIDFAAEAMQQSPELIEAPWADLGTGSGAIAVGVGDLLRKSGAEKVLQPHDSLLLHPASRAAKLL